MHTKLMKCKLLSSYVYPPVKFQVKILVHLKQLVLRETKCFPNVTFLFYLNPLSKIYESYFKDRTIILFTDYINVTLHKTNNLV